MKITIEEQDSRHEIIKIVNAQYLGDYKISIQFNDGTYHEVDFKPFLSKSQHPEIRKYLDEKLFKEFEIHYGNLNWHDYDLIFPIWDLYQGQIEKD